MWNFSKYGFTSIVAYDPTKDRKPDSPFPKIAKKAGTHLLVRARIKADLDQLKRIVPSLVIDTDASHVDLLDAARKSRSIMPRRIERLDGVGDRL